MVLLRRYYSYIILLFLCLSAIFVGTLFNRTHSAEFSNTTHSAEFSKQTAQNAVTASRRTAIVTAVAKASPAVVNISAVRERQTSFDEWFWGEIPTTRRRSLREVGSGVVVHKNGHILTSHRKPIRFINRQRTTDRYRWYRECNATRPDRRQPLS